MASSGGKNEGPKKRGLVGFLEFLNDFQADYDKEMQRDAIASGKKPPKSGSPAGLLAGLATLAFGDKIKEFDEKLLDWELSRERRELEIEKVAAERQHYIPQPRTKDKRVLQIIEDLRRKVRDRAALVTEQERLIGAIRQRRRGEPLTEDDIREIESIKEAVARYIDEL